METRISLIFFFLVMVRLSPAEDEKRNLTGVVGGSITLPQPLLEDGFLLLTGVVASVTSGTLQIVKQKYQNKLQWNKDSGLFTLTDLQKNDSGVYKIQFPNKDLTVFHTLNVYDPAPSPAVQTQTLSSDSCWLICSVEHQATLLWIRDQEEIGKEILNQKSSALSLNVTVQKKDRISTYSCVAANPAENKTVDVDVKQSCWFNKNEATKDQRKYWIPPVVCVVFIALVALGVWLVKQKYLDKKTSIRQTQGSVKEEEVQYTPIHFRDKREQVPPQENIPDSSGTSSDAHLTTVYAKLEHLNTNRLC